MANAHLRHALFKEKERAFVELDGLEVSLFRYDKGVEAVRVGNRRGYVIVPHYFGQMLWDASFDGVRLGMGHKYPAPRPARVIVDTYGCLTFHSVLLCNGRVRSLAPGDSASFRVGLGYLDSAAATKMDAAIRSL